MLSVPDPHPNDPEGVVSALETAAIFGTQGDVKEAVRWVRKAAEIAGDEGNDERALTLARAIADLNISASQPPQPPAPSQTPAAAPPVRTAPPVHAATAAVAPAAAAPPPPPPLPGGAAPALAAAATAYDPDGDAETRVVESAAVLAEFQKQQSNGNGAAHAVPVLPPPSMSAVATPVATPAEMVAAVAAFNEELPPPPPPPPVPSATAADTAPDFAKEEESTPPSRSGIGSMAELLARKEAEVSTARAAADAMEQPDDAHADAGWDEPPPPPPPPPAQASVPPVERRTAHPAERIQTPLIPSQPYLERPPVNAPVHQAVRGSIVATAEPGVFVLRVLTAEQAPAPTAHEVLVVVTDPSSSPFK